MHHGVDVDAGERRQREHDGVTVDRAAVTYHASDLGEAPAQSAERVVGFGEEQPSETGAAGWTLGEHQVGEQRPAFAAAKPVRLVAGRLDAWSTEEVDDEAHGVCIVP